MMTDHLLT